MTSPPHWCSICQLDLQSSKSLAEHGQGRKHRKRAFRQNNAAAAPDGLCTSLSDFALSAISQDELFEELANGKYQNIIMLTGAGVSTNAGVPDFRSADGIFGALKERFVDRFPVVRDTPEFLLSRDFVSAYPQIWKEEIWPLAEGSTMNAEFKPTITHKFAAWLHQQGWLRRIYTQNIDGLHLHESLNLPEDIVIECHGSLRNKEDPTLVLYGDPLPDRFLSSLRRDFDLNSADKVDLVLVFGTSLQVMPFCALPNLAPRGATRVLVNRNINECLVNHLSSPLTPRSFSSIKLGGRKAVTLKSLWTDRKANRKWRQLLVESDCDEFVEKFFASPPCLQKGYHL